MYEVGLQFLAGACLLFGGAASWHFIYCKKYVKIAVEEAVQKAELDGGFQRASLEIKKIALDGAEKGILGRLSNVEAREIELEIREERLAKMRKELDSDIMRELQRRSTYNPVNDA